MKITKALREKAVELATKQIRDSLNNERKELFQTIADDVLSITPRCLADAFKKYPFLFKTEWTAVSFIKTDGIARAINLSSLVPTTRASVINESKLEEVGNKYAQSICDIQDKFDAFSKFYDELVRTVYEIKDINLLIKIAGSELIGESPKEVSTNDIDLILAKGKSLVKKSK